MELGPVHFIHLGGELEWQHWRAIKTAKVHKTPILLWTTGDVVSQVPGVGIRQLDLPVWLKEHPIQLANVKDHYAYSLLFTHGGIYLDLDTISLRPVWDLMPNDKDLVVSTEYHPDDPHPVRNNSAVMIGRRDAAILRSLAEMSLEMLRAGESKWGAIGPSLVSHCAESRLAAVIEQAPYRALNGWSYHEISDYYANPRDPGKEVRVIHLYSSDHPEWLEDTWMP